MAVAPAPPTVTHDSPRPSGTALRLGLTGRAATLQGGGPSGFGPWASSAPDDPLVGNSAVA